MRQRIKRGIELLKEEKVEEIKPQEIQIKPKKKIKKIKRAVIKKPATPVIGDIMDDFKPAIHDDVTDEQIELELKKLKIKYENGE